MVKINGYTEEEAKSFISYVCSERAIGKTLTGIFNEYSKRTGRAKGSVRNYYYSLLKSRGDKRVDELLQGTNLKAEKIKEFTEEETNEILREILKYKARGVSVRRAVLELANGDDKLMLRYQNKYRNVLSKQPEKLQKIMRECGISLGQSGEMQKRLEEEINGLYDRLASSLKEENKRLYAVIKSLTDENSLLNMQVKNLQ